MEPFPATTRLLPATASPFSLLTDEDLQRLGDGTHSSLYSKFGSHPVSVSGAEGTYFALWAPNAREVSVVGDFNRWTTGATPLARCRNSGVWETFVPGVARGSNYKFRLRTHYGHVIEKADPFAIRTEMPPRTASIVWNSEHQWNDAEWLAQRRDQNWRERPVSIYEMHAGSWMRVPEECNRWLTYRELAPKIAAYALQQNFTHVELLPLAEHPFYGSWGYQPLGFYAPTSRYGTPEDLMFFVDYLHQQGLGVIFDWVPLHFPYDAHGLARFDGTCLFEHADPRNHHHPAWGSVIFNYERPEVCSFLLSNAMYWLRQYHADGLRADAISYMVYRNYGRRHGQWTANRFGGHENLEAVAFLKDLHQRIANEMPDVLTCAEEASTFPQVSHPPHAGGLGFTFKWDMGWMHDTLEYMAKPFHARRSQLNRLTFRQLYAFSENFVLPLSHDEVVHCKGSLLNKLPGNHWDKFAGLRLLFGYMFAQPGKKLLFMGGEFGQWREWNHDQSLDWHLLDNPNHRGIQHWVRDLNHAYREFAPLHQCDGEPAGFEWIDCHDHNNQVLTFLRKTRDSKQAVLVLCHFLPGVLHNYRVGVPWPGQWREILNSDARDYGGSGAGNAGGVHSEPRGCHGRPQSINITVPPLAVSYFLYEPDAAEATTK